MDQVVARLKAIIAKANIITEYDNICNYESNPQSSHSTGNDLESTQISEHYPDVMVNELVNLNFKEINEGKEKKVRKQHVLNYIENHRIILRDIYNWLLNKQNN